MDKIEVASSPHLSRTDRSTQWMMMDVLLALAPAAGVAIWIFGWYAIFEMGLCVLTCLVSEWIFSKMRGRRSELWDCSALVTGLILGLSLPWSAPWYVPVFGSLIAIGAGKMAYGGLGMNIFNPAMVGRAFVMISFATAMGTGAYVLQNPEDTQQERVVTQPTPMSVMKHVQDSESGIQRFVSVDTLLNSVSGKRNGSLGEVSVLALCLGGLYLILRNTISWRIPVSMLATVFVLGMLVSPLHAPWAFGLAHMLNGAVLLGAFFIATDPVSSPITPRGKIYFGIGIGLLTMIFRLFSNYPEGVMFAVLIMNAVVPMLNNVTIPKPFGYEKPAKQDAR